MIKSNKSWKDISQIYTKQIYNFIDNSAKEQPINCHLQELIKLIEPLDDVEYTILAYDINGCAIESELVIEVDKNRNVYIPNIFTPDGDGVNNEFMPIISGVMPESYEFLVFNRWGELIFQSQIVGQGWDGTYKNVMSQQDVYVWKLKVDDQLGKGHEYIGHVTLIK